MELFPQCLTDIVALTQATSETHWASFFQSAGLGGHLLNNGVHHSKGNILLFLSLADEADDLGLYTWS